MTKADTICAVCSTSGTEVYSECGHILHRYCLSKLKCPKCKRGFFSDEIEILLAKIQFTDGLERAEEHNLINCVYGLFNRSCQGAQYNDKSLCKLKSFGWNINSEKYGASIRFYEACRDDDIDRVNLFIDHGFDLKKYGEKGMEEACLNVSYCTVERLRNLGVKVCPILKYDLIRSKNLEAIKFVIENGADVNDSSMEYPIHAAAEIGSVEVIALLIKYGADFNAVTENGDTLMHVAASKNNNMRLIKYLRESGFDLNARNHVNQKTPLMISLENRKACVTRYLVNAGVNLEDVDKDGRTALHHCVRQRESLERLEFLLQSGANVNAKDFKGETPLHRRLF